MTEPRTVFIAADHFDAARVLADIAALPGPVRLVLPELAPAIEAEVAQRALALGTVVGFWGLPQGKVVFADQARAGTDWIPIWPDLILAYPAPPAGKTSITWGIIAHAINMGRIVAVWLPWLTPAERARDGAWQAIVRGLAGLGIPGPVVADRGGRRAFPFADKETEHERLPDTSMYLHALVRAGDDD